MIGESSAVESEEAKNYLKKVFVAGGLMVIGVIAFIIFLVIMVESGEPRKLVPVIGLIFSASIAVAGYVFRNVIRIRRMSVLRKKEQAIPKQEGPAE